MKKTKPKKKAFVSSVALLRQVMPQAYTKTLQHSDGRHVIPLLPMSKTSALIQRIDTRKLIVAKLCKILALFPK